jgi:hypothetical protein
LGEQYLDGFVVGDDQHERHEEEKLLNQEEQHQFDIPVCFSLSVEYVDSGGVQIRHVVKIFEAIPATYSS